MYKNDTMHTLLDKLDIIELYEYEDQEPHWSEITKKQAEIYKNFDIDLPNTV
jgi:hypothetical protein